MKKILSLLALLVTTVTAFATDYTDAFSYTILQMSESFDSKTLTVTDKGDGTYDVTIKGFNAATIGQNFGDMTFAGMSGTTTGDVTTINATNVTATQTEGTFYTFVAADVTVKFNADKAYFHAAGKISGAYNFEQTFGTDEGFGGDTPVTPVVEYPVNFDKTATNNHVSRCTSSISLQQEGKDKQTITLNSSLNGYEDHSEGEPFTVDAGSEVTPTFGYNGEWMHGYVYVDLDGNKQFDVNADDLDNSPELVAYSYYKNLNSDGKYADASVNVNPPSFTAPTVPGTYRIRFKIDWDNVDPGGCVESSNHILNNGGGIWDATLVVEGIEPPFEPVVRTATDVANMTYNGTTTNYDANNVEVTEYEAGKLKVTYKDLTVGNTRLGDLTIDNVTSVANENGTETLSTTATEATWSNVSDNQLVLSLIQSETAAISNFAATLVPGTEANTIEKLNLSFNLVLAGTDVNVVFGEKAEILPEPTVYTDKAHTTYWGDFDYTDKVVNVYDLGENKYKVVYKEFNLGSSTKFDLVLNNVEGTTDDEGFTTYTFNGKAITENVHVDQGVIASVSEGGEVDATLEGKSKDGKLYATFTMSTMGNTATTVYGSEFEQPVPPAEVEETKTYTDNLTYLVSTTTGTNADQELTVEKMTDGTYNLKFANVNSYNTLYMELGEITMTGVEGTTDEDGLTTIEATAPAVTLGEDGFLNDTKEGTLVAKFNGEKAYLHYTGNLKATYGSTFNYELTYGTDEFTTPDEPKADYAINFDKDGQNHHASRRTTSVSLQQEGKDVQTLTFDDSTNGYEDHSEDIHFSVEAGSEVATTFGYNGEWMHGYVYIDLDGNKQFDVNADDLDNSPELVAYSYYNDLNSDGEAVSANVNVTPPTFTAPATSGTYRIRFKIDWNSVDPGGCVDDGNHILNNGGGIWDATLEVTEPIVDAINSINAEATQGNAEIFTVNGTKVAKLQKGINLVRTADGKVKKVLVK